MAEPDGLNRREAMISEMEYRKGNYIARMAVLDTDNRRFRGMVLIRKHGEEEIEKFCAAVESDNVDDGAGSQDSERTRRLRSTG